MAPSELSGWRTYSRTFSRVGCARTGSDAHEYGQILSSVEERTLERWITHLTSSAFPASPALAASSITNNVSQRLES